MALKELDIVVILLTTFVICVQITPCLAHCLEDLYHADLQTCEDDLKIAEAERDQAQEQLLKEQQKTWTCCQNIRYNSNDVKYESIPIAQGSDHETGYNKLVNADQEKTSNEAIAASANKAIPSSTTITGSTQTTTTTTTTTTTKFNICDECSLPGESVMPVLEEYLGETFAMAEEYKKATMLRTYLESLTKKDTEDDAVKEENNVEEDEVKNDEEANEKGSGHYENDLESTMAISTTNHPPICEQHLQDCLQDPAKYQRARRFNQALIGLINFKADASKPPFNPDCEACEKDLARKGTLLANALTAKERCDSEYSLANSSYWNCEDNRRDEVEKNVQEKAALENQLQFKDNTITALTNSTTHLTKIKEILEPQNQELEERIKEFQQKIGQFINKSSADDGEKRRLRLELDQLDDLKEHNAKLALINGFLLSMDNEGGLKDEYLNNPAQMYKAASDNPKLYWIGIGLIIALGVAVSIIIALSISLHYANAQLKAQNSAQGDDLEMGVFYRQHEEEGQPPVQPPLQDPEQKASNVGAVGQGEQPDHREPVDDDEERCATSRQQDESEQQPEEEDQPEPEVQVPLPNRPLPAAPQARAENVEMDVEEANHAAQSEPVYDSPNQNERLANGNRDGESDYLSLKSEE